MKYLETLTQGIRDIFTLPVTQGETSLITSLELRNSKSPLSIESPTEKDGISYIRSLCIHGRPLYEFGPNCETCQFFLSQVGINQSSLTVQAIKSVFDHHTEHLSDDTIQAISVIFPQGAYQVLFKTFTPLLLDTKHIKKLYSQNIDGDFTPYLIRKQNITPTLNRYKTRGSKFQEITLIDVVIPIQSPTSLQESVIQQYEDQFTHGEIPCGLSLSVLEVHGRDYWYNIGLIHFLLDGHHKMYAAAKRRCPIHLLTFCALDYGCSRLPVKLEDDGSSSFRKGRTINFLVREGFV